MGFLQINSTIINKLNKAEIAEAVDQKALDLKK